MPSSLDTFFFWNSGAEAIEAAVKFARAATGRPGVVVFNGSYHGRTIGTMAMTTSKDDHSKTIYAKGFAYLMPAVYVAPHVHPFGEKSLRDGQIVERDR